MNSFSPSGVSRLDGRQPSGGLKGILYLLLQRVPRLLICAISRHMATRFSHDSWLILCPGDTTVSRKSRPIDTLRAFTTQNGWMASRKTRCWFALDRYHVQISLRFWMRFLALVM